MLGEDEVVIRSVFGVVAFSLLVSLGGCSPAPAPLRSSSGGAGAGAESRRDLATAASVSSPRAAPTPVGCPPSSEPAFELWADNAVRVHLLAGASWVSDGLSVATESDAQLVQDTLLTATAECAEGDTFEAFAGTFPKSAWAVRSNRGAVRLYEFGARGWRQDRRLSAVSWLLSSFREGALALVVPKSNPSGRSYELIGLPSKPGSRPARGEGECRTRLAQPLALVGNRRGDAAVLGQLCGAAAKSLALELFPAKSALSSVVPAPTGVTAPRLALDADGQPMLAGTRGSQGIVARYIDGAWRELPALAAPVTALAVGEDQQVWVATSLPAAPSDCNGARDAASGAQEASNLHHLSGDRWANVALPAGAGKVTQVAIRAADDVWVATERALFRTRRARAVLRWSHAGYCPLPITGAKPYTYHRIPARNRRIESVGELVGADCQHLILVDTTSEPTSAVFDAVVSAIESTDLLGRAMREAESAYDAALENPPRASIGSPSPYVSYEAGRFNWGIWADSLQDAPRVTELLREKFPSALRELCASPYPIRLDAITKRSAASPTR